mmetsp:Transcript_121369/g.305213  ORF Transcript_121369/g.305213 Transcript_121369/m.305213 type:complete len:197 (-) Transcript_121369:246-836(-)
MAFKLAAVVATAATAALQATAEGAAAEAVVIAARPTNHSGSLRGKAGLSVGGVAASSAQCTARFYYDCRSTAACCDAGLYCYEKNQYWAACLRTCTPGTSVEGDESNQPWTCRVLGGWVAPSQPVLPPVWHSPTPQPAPTPASTPAPTPALPLPPAPAPLCEDNHESCAGWAARDECAKNPGYMNATCPKACGLCQ